MENEEPGLIIEMDTGEAEQATATNCTSGPISTRFLYVPSQYSLTASEMMTGRTSLSGGLKRKYEDDESLCPISLHYTDQLKTVSLGCTDQLQSSSLGYIDRSNSSGYNYQSMRSVHFTSPHTSQSGVSSHSYVDQCRQLLDTAVVKLRSVANCPVSRRRELSPRRAVLLLNTLHSCEGKLRSVGVASRVTESYRDLNATSLFKPFVVVSTLDGKPSRSGGEKSAGTKSSESCDPSMISNSVSTETPLEPSRPCSSASENLNASRSSYSMFTEDDSSDSFFFDACDVDDVVYQTPVMVDLSILRDISGKSELEIPSTTAVGGIEVKRILASNSVGYDDTLSSTNENGSACPNSANHGSSVSASFSIWEEFMSFLDLQEVARANNAGDLHNQSSAEASNDMASDVLLDLDDLIPTSSSMNSLGGWWEGIVSCSSGVMSQAWDVGSAGGNNNTKMEVSAVNGCTAGLNSSTCVHRNELLTDDFDRLMQILVG